MLSRAVGSEKLFWNVDDYHIFLRRLRLHVLSVADIFSYALLPNHFHLLAKIKELDALEPVFQEVKKDKDKTFCPEIAPDFVMERFSNHLNSYAKTFNNQYHRKGGLFIDYYRSVEVLSDRQFRSTAFYIHNNPVRHGYCKNIMDCPWTSFRDIISSYPSWVQKETLLEKFGGRKALIRHHSQYSAPIEVDQMDELDI
jgi:putative transposase